jgi:hypothetical protein
MTQPFHQRLVLGKTRHQQVAITQGHIIVFESRGYRFTDQPKAM